MEAPFKKKKCIYLAASGLSCGMQIVASFETSVAVLCADALVVACWLSSCGAWA